ncbi:MAG TPA: DISARM system SNF2-like helicase DrmD, partial [Ruminococcus flavefaciens]|nr:DISARM system SNF2-like helicase DrmD [Ruminococcus flavefaciens]
SSKLMKAFPKAEWDFIIIDEAHNLRNVFHGTKRAKNLFELSKGIPKILLTATPLQNSLTDLHGLISFIDPRIFGSEKVFVKRYVNDQDYADLKHELLPVLYRTLRKDVAKYMNFKKRICKTVDFSLSVDEIELYQRVNDFLKRDILYSIPTSNRGLIILVIRKLLASSSFALIETFEVLKQRLEKLYEGTRSANAQEGFDLFWSYVEDEIDESGFEEPDDEDTVIQKQYIKSEIDEIGAIIAVANRITTNAKLQALKSAIKIAFDYQQEHEISQKVVVFTESKRTQKYIANELRKEGYQDDDIVLFNGDFDDAMSKELYRAWQVKNFGKVNYGRSVEYKHAIVDYFKNNAKILICTDAGSEGLNLQFCNAVINYDLPWNPMKIEQRIGRCHRYGQQNDVVAINLLNTQNAADQRVYEILSKKFELFEGVFGASDIALGVLESGVSFEKMILEIYQSCNTTAEFKKAFDKLDRKLNAKRDKKAKQLRSLLLTESSNAKEASLDKTKEEIAEYLREVEYWSDYTETRAEGGLRYLELNNECMKTFCE